MRTRIVLAVLASLASLSTAVVASAADAPAAANAPLVLAQDAARPADPLSARIRQGFVDSIYGQVHYLTSAPERSLPESAWKTPLVMFHQSPLSAREFGPLIAEMGRDRIVFAFDTPGQGLSDGPDQPVRMAQLAAVMEHALAQLGYDARRRGTKRQVDVFGNHTGVWIAGELAIRNPGLVRKLVFNGIYLVPEDIWRANIAHLTLQDSSGEFFDTMATYLVASRKRYMSNGMSDADWGRMVVDTLAPRQRREFVHLSAFSYAAEAPTRLPLITQPVTVLLIDDGIADPSRAALPLLRHVAGIVDRMQWKEGLFYTHTAEVGAVLRAAFD